MKITRYISFNKEEYLILRDWWVKHINLMIEELGFVVLLEPMSIGIDLTSMFETLKFNEYLTETSRDVEAFDYTPEIPFKLDEMVLIWLYKRGVPKSIETRIYDHLAYLGVDVLDTLIELYVPNRNHSGARLLRLNKPGSDLVLFNVNEESKITINEEPLHIVGSDSLLTVLDSIKRDLIGSDEFVLIIKGNLLISVHGDNFELNGVVIDDTVVKTERLVIDFNHIRTVELPKIEFVTNLSTLGGKVKMSNIAFSLVDTFHTASEISLGLLGEVDSDALVSSEFLKLVYDDYIPEYVKLYLK